MFIETLSVKCYHIYPKHDGILIAKLMPLMLFKTILKLMFTFSRLHFIGYIINVTFFVCDFCNSKNINNTDTFKMSDCPMAQKASSQK